MILTRRELLIGASGALLAVTLPVLASGQPSVLIEMRGTARGERVWFDPFGVAVKPGTRVRFVNRDSGNAHTVTAYHPEVLGRVRRIPEKAIPFNSDYLLPEDTYELILTSPGVYDFYCIPHEQAGMVGRVVVGDPGEEGWDNSAVGAGGVAESIEAAFPSVESILASGSISASELK
ncbi:plastocyanin/azurin family copper-binding protein [Marinobacter sediminicola]|uniref:plastocyanin/azurin family copper-binding protein n=1 Tax=Marinobacter sediminicola TaxID=3072994 RepID=UPI0028113E7C|nr:plastocyanin/azurin family copper-binding protein [Marinobacter sp. F26243]